MKQENNKYAITGVIYEKPVRRVQGKKDTTQFYEFPSVILEVSRQYKDKTYTELPEFELGRGVSLDQFEIGDKVEIVFALAGKRLTDTFHKTTAKAIYIRHTDIERDDTKTVGGETITEARKRERAEKEVFIPPSPLKDDDEDDNLPF